MTRRFHLTRLFYRHTWLPWAKLVTTIARHTVVDLSIVFRTRPDEKAQERLPPEKLREILILAHFHKFPYAEIGGILGIPLRTVKSRLHTAVNRFAED